MAKMTKQTALTIVLLNFVAMFLFLNFVSTFNFAVNDTGRAMSSSVDAHLRGGADGVAAETVPVEEARLADGCYHVFLDVGANIGVHGRFLFEPDQYPDAVVAQRLFNKEFGTSRDNRDFCVFAFEPNPSQHPKIRAKEEAYAAMGWRYHLIPHGVSDEDSSLTFFRRGDEKRSEWGFNALLTEVNGKDAVKVEVPVVRLARWIEQHVSDRRLPTTVHGDYTGIADGHDGVPKVVMKMDIEAMEFRVLPDLLYSGVFCRDLDYVFGELHGNKKWYPMELPNGVRFKNGAAGLSYLRSFTSAVNANPHCATRFEEEDDEAYLLDGIPLPTPSKEA
uniref:Methyltransferase FkbM domain-containing protein n=1 Tax=Amphora coffeiformis TaxID=265554 RepID=A0A7S3LHX6_9STRA